MSEISYIYWSSMNDKSIEAFIGNFIKHQRIEQGKTQQALALSAGISRSTLSLLEKGETVTLNTLIRVLRMLNQLHVLENFKVEETISPLLLAEMQRERISRVRGKNKSKK